MIKLHFNGTTLEVHESDSSYRYRSLMAKPQLVLKFSLPEYKEIPIGTWCEFMGKRYTLPSPQNIKKHGKRNIDYTLIMVDDEDNLGNFKFRNPVDGRLKWSMCAKPKEFLQAIVDCMNKRDSGWSVGSYIDSTEKTIEFNHVYLDEALQDVAATFDTEYEVNGNVISLGKVEYFKDSPLNLSYGKGNGFMPGVGRSTLSDEKPIKILYVQGGEKNIDRSKYGSPTLLLPKSQSLEYEGRTYGTDKDGLYIQRTDKVSDAVKDDSLDCSEIYPSRVGTVSSVKVVDAESNFYDFTDNTIPDELDFNDYIIEGETPVIRFQSGMLAGEKDFEFKYIHKDEEGNAVRRFELVPQEIDGQTMPNASFAPVVGDKYAIFGIMLPDAYICNDKDKSGASWDMFREGVKYLYEHEEQKFTFSGELQALWAKRNWENVGGKLVVGGYVMFRDEQFATEGVLIRITGIKEYLTSPYSPTIEISNSVAGKSFSSTMRDIENTEVKIDDTTKYIIQFTKRRFRDAQETMLMLEDAMLNFSGSINPVTVQTMAALVGDESLQFRFVSSKTSLKQVAYSITYDTAAKQLHCPHGFLQHMTLGIKSIASEHKASEYKTWEMNEFLSGVLNEPKKKYYLYAKVSSTSTDTQGNFILSETAIDMNAVSGYYHLLTGVLNSEYEGGRSFVTLYGFTEILPGRITTDKIVSTDGNTYFDLSLGEIGGNIKIKAGSSGLNNFEEFEELSNQISALDKALGKTDGAIEDLEDYIDGAFADGIITEAEAKAIEKYINTVNSTKAGVEATYNKLYANSYLSGTPKTNLLNAKITLFGAIDDLLSAINTAIADGVATVAEKNNVDSKFTSFNSALSSFNTAVEAANKAIQDELKDSADAQFEVLSNQISAQVTRIDTINNTISSAGWITKADGNTFWASKTMENGDTLISYINQAAGSTTIASSKINLVGAVTFNSFSTALQGTINGKADSSDLGDLASKDSVSKAMLDSVLSSLIDGKADASGLGSLAYKSAVESAMLGSTIIVGGYLNTDYIKVKKIEAIEGTIAGFHISGTGLINTGFDNDAYLIFRNDTHKTFAGIGGNVLPSSTGLRAVARFENHDTEDFWYMGANYAMLVSAQGGRENVAIQLNGGSVACLALKTQIIGHDNIVQSTAPTSKYITLGRDVGSLYVSTHFNWKSSSSATSYESKARDIYLTLPTMDVYDDGHTIKIKRGSNNSKWVYISPGGSYRMVYNSSTGTYVRTYGTTYIMYDGASYATTSDKLGIESEGDAMELVYHRDLQITINNITYYGCWIQHKHPRSW
ncbi:MAG: hypothetical protein IKU25_00180 [Clostridia bacterium]|nr:hypothetical protein [Clostridia bacterium]